ncbi:alpha/beta hydrolase [Kushneria phyllosphaerae]|uniref:Carboxylesterase NlhH n=1 Tax=Kushneria phyllosphaerae TaxID=2100822 RepID=A0A2R8CLK1_9GAMM|nr:alpha/beta hydrolase [Kushneria phyllosphaerae]SPJ33778.1 Carboxylesterase NlhH [Kushneria phyllosphaerae]
MKTVLDVTYATPGGQALKADLYLPTATGTPPPVIMFLHGGGWKFGDRRLAPDLARYFAYEGFAMISIDYRLSGQAPFPAAVEDVKTAIRWVRSEAATYGYDADHLGLWGSSAGSHLATLAVTSGPEHFRSGPYLEENEQVQAVVDGYGPTDFLRQDEYRDLNGTPSDDPESIQMPPGKFSADADSMESLFIVAPINEAPERVAAANPITYVTAGLPPMLILHGLSDTAVPWQQSRLLFEALSRTGNPATLGLIEGLGHGFFNRNTLDDDGPHTIHLYRSDAPDRAQVEAHDVFGLVEAFFRDNLR